MLKALVTYYELAVKTVETDAISWSKVREITNDVWFRLTQMKVSFLLDRSWNAADGLLG